MSGKAKLSGPLLVLLVKASKNQGPILPSTVEPVLASSAESPGLGRDSPVPVRPAVASAAQPPLPSRARLFLGTQTPQSCQGEAFQSGKKENISPKDVLKLEKKKRHGGVSGTSLYCPSYKVELGVLKGQGALTRQSHSLTGFQGALRAPRCGGRLKTLTSSTVFPWWKSPEARNKFCPLQNQRGGLS